MNSTPRTRETWQDRFEASVKYDAIVRGIISSLEKKGVRRERLLLLLEAASDPHVQSRLQRFAEGERPPITFWPNKRDATQLAQTLRRTASDIRTFWARPMFAFFPYSTTAVEIAEKLEEQAQALADARWSVITKRVGYKAFWRQLPLALLCLEVQTPTQLPYTKLSQLIGAARRAHGCPDDDATLDVEAIRRKYERFCKRQAAHGGLDMLRGLLTIIPSSDRPDTKTSKKI